MIDPEEKLLAAAQKARADHETAREIAARLLAPPDPVDILAGVIADHGEVADERDELRAERDALTAELEAIRGMVGRYGHGVTAVKAVRSIVAALDEARAAGRESCATTANGYRSIAGALGILDSQASVPSILAAIADMVNKIADLSSFLSTAETDAETQRTAADDLRAALDRVATAAGVGTDSTASIVADLVVDAIRRLSSDRDQMRVAREDAAEDLERLNAILSSAGIDTTGPAADVADRVAAALRRPALPADMRAHLEKVRNAVLALGCDEAEVAAIDRWLALPTAEVTK